MIENDVYYAWREVPGMSADNSDNTDLYQKAIDSGASVIELPGGGDIPCAGPIQLSDRQKHRGVARSGLGASRTNFGTRVLFTGNSSGFVSPAGSPLDAFELADLAVFTSADAEIDCVLDLLSPRNFNMSKVALGHGNPNPDRLVMRTQAIPGQETWTSQWSQVLFKGMSGPKQTDGCVLVDTDMTAIYGNEIYFNGGQVNFRGHCGHSLGVCHFDSCRGVGGNRAALNFIATPDCRTMGCELGILSFLQNDVAIRVDGSNGSKGRVTTNFVLQGFGFDRNSLDIDLINCDGALIGLNAWSDKKSLTQVGKPVRLTNSTAGGVLPQPWKW